MVTQEDRELNKYYPNHTDKFHAYRGGINFDWNGMAYDVFKKEIGGPVHHYDDNVVEHALTNALGSREIPSNFPDELMLNKKTTVQYEGNFPRRFILTSIIYPIPKIEASSFSNNLYPLKIFITPDKYFISHPNNIFQLTPESTTDRYEPNMRLWSQQLNLAVWCATGGCGISYEMLTDTPVGALLKFHVLYTIRTILDQLEVPLPWHEHFVWDGTHYNHNAYIRICNEFSLKNPDFRFHLKTHKYLNFHYVSPNPKLTGYYTSTPENRSQYNWFILKKSSGLTAAGVARLNKSIEAFVYTILGAQVNSRSSIYGTSGSALETQQVFLQLFESSIIERDISKSIQRFQLAIQEAKVKLDLAVSPGCWLLPSNLMINTGSIIGYNNMLVKATSDMRFGVNNINNSTKRVGIDKTYNMGHSANKLPHQINNNPKPDNFNKPDASEFNKPIKKPSPTKTHENKLVVITVVAAGLAWICFR